MKEKALSILRLFLITVFTTIFSTMSYADVIRDVGPYNTDSFITNIRVNKDYTFDVEEKITVDFTTPKHGIFRVIPVTYGRYRISDINVEGGEVKVSKKEINKGVYTKIIRIGSKNKYLEGKKTYVIRYKIEGVDVYGSSETLRLNLIPTNWQTPINYAKTTVTMPTKFDFKESNIFFGGYNSKDKISSLDIRGQKIDVLDSDTRYKFLKTDNTMVLEIHNLGEKTGASLVQKIGNNYWNGEHSYNNRLIIVNSIIGILFVITILTFAKNKPKTRIVQTVEFNPPDKISPVEMGYILEGRTSDSHLSATIIYLANKGYLSINEIEKNSFELKKIRDIDEKEKNFLKVFFRAIFYKTDTINMSDFDENFADKMVVVKNMVSANFIDDKSVYKRSSIVYSIIFTLLLYVLGFVFFVYFSKINNNTGFLYLGVGFLTINTVLSIVSSILNIKKYIGKKGIKFPIKLVFIIAILAEIIMMYYLNKISYNTSVGYNVIVFFILNFLTLIFSIRIIRRTDYNLSIIGRIMGFKDFIEKVELKKLELLVEQDPKYFYNILPYAYILGLSDVWIKKFDSINIDKPDWYSSEMDDSYFNIFMCISYMNYCNHNVFSNIDSLNMSSTEFSGGGYTGGSGGFSGGGFGGGGGGAW